MDGRIALLLGAEVVANLLICLLDFLAQDFFDLQLVGILGVSAAPVCYGLVDASALGQRRKAPVVIQQGAHSALVKVFSSARGLLITRREQVRVGLLLLRGGRATHGRRGLQ